MEEIILDGENSSAGAAEEENENSCLAEENERLAAEIETLTRRLEEKEAAFSALSEENERLSSKLEATARLPKFSAATEEKSDRLGEIKKIFRKR